MHWTRRLAGAALVMTLLGLGAVACGSSGGGKAVTTVATESSAATEDSNLDSADTLEPADTTSDDSTPVETTGGGFTDQGDMKVVLEDATNSDDDIAKGLLEATGSVAGVADLINSTVVLPTDTAIVFTSEDDGTGPHYSPDDLQITFPYSFVGFIADTIQKNSPDISDEDLAVETDNAVAFILLHEIGHALVHQLQLPLLSKEEDVADNIATVLLSTIGKDGGQIALSGAQFFADLQGDPSDFTENTFWDEHSLDLQRANQTACLVYGSDPKAFASLEEVIPPERLVRCPGEWDQIASGLRTVLDPYLKG